MSSEARFVGLDAGRDGIEAWVRPTGEVWKMDAGEAGMTRAAETLSRTSSSTCCDAGQR